MHVHAAPANNKRMSRVLWISMVATLAYVALTLLAGLRAHSLAHLINVRQPIGRLALD